MFRYNSRYRSLYGAELMRRAWGLLIGWSLWPGLAFAACDVGYLPTLETSPTFKLLVCDTAADVPTSGLTEGDLVYLRDSNRFASADSATTYATPAYDSPVYLIAPHGTSLTASWCDDASEAGKVFVKTDATSGKQFYACEGVAGWKLQGDGDSGGAPAWGSVTGTLSNQTDLQSALDAKQAADADLTDLSDGVLTPSKVEAFPVGSVFLSVVSTNPGTLLGYGTWSAIATGRVLVGIDTGDANFDVVKETGGAKTVASSAQTFAGASSTVVVNHVHTQAAGTTTTGNFTQVTTAADTSSGGTGGTPTQTALSTTTGNPTVGGAASYTPAGTNTPGAATSVVQPYYVVYIFERIS